MVILRNIYVCRLYLYCLHNVTDIIITTQTPNTRCHVYKNEPYRVCVCLFPFYTAKREIIFFIIIIIINKNGGRPQ